MTALDGTFLELEEADPGAHMHIGAIVTFAQRPDGSTPELHELRSVVAERIGHLPRFSERLSDPVTGGLRFPQWERVTRLDLTAHVRHAALPAPGGDAELSAWAADYWSVRLDRERPLWEMVLVEGLAGGRWALVTKTHHALADGVGSVDLAHVLFDADADGTPIMPAGTRPVSTRRSTAGITDVAGRVFRSGTRFVRDPAGEVGGAIRRSRALAELLVRDEVIAAPSTSLNTHIGARRRYAVVHVPLAELKAISGALGGKVNDVALTVVTGGLRAVLLERGEQPPSRGLRAMVPVNVRTGAEMLTLGNRISSLFVHLPVAEETTLARHAHVLEETARRKGSDETLGSETLLDLASALPPVVHSFVARALFATRLFNVTVTNVPGPQQTLYALGCPALEIAGLVPLAADHTVGVAILSYDGHVTFGVIADHDEVADISVITRGMESTLSDLRALAGAVAAPR